MANRVSNSNFVGRDIWSGSCGGVEHDQLAATQMMIITNFIEISSPPSSSHQMDRLLFSSLSSVCHCSHIVTWPQIVYCGYQMTIYDGYIATVIKPSSLQHTRTRANPLWSQTDATDFTMFWALYGSAQRQNTGDDGPDLTSRLFNHINTQFKWFCLHENHSDVVQTSFAYTPSPHIMRFFECT